MGAATALLERPVSDPVVDLSIESKRQELSPAAIEALAKSRSPEMIR